jgi:hypothetical protein
MRCSRCRALIVSLIVSVGHSLACGSDSTESKSPSIDASVEGGADSDAGETSDVPAVEPDISRADSTTVRDTSTDACILPEGNACVSPITGCPSAGRCMASGFFCPCVQCDVVIEPSSCSWTVEDPKVMLGRTSVRMIDAEGGQRTLNVSGPPDCMGSDGYWVEVLSGRITITLCPTSCAQYRADPTLSFTFTRGGCPLSAP